MLLAAVLVASLQGNIKVRLVTDEPEIALQILQQRQEGKTVTDDDWSKLFATEGYKRLKDRELGMKRSFTEADFRTFMLSDDLLKQRPALEDTLAKWKKVDVAACAHKSLSYLPPGSQVGASVYYLIKP